MLFKSILIFFNQTTSHGKQSLLSLTGSSYFSKVCLPNASPSAVRQAILMWRSAVTVDRQTATVWRTTDGQSFGTRPLVNFHFVTFFKNVASSDKRGHRHMKIVWRIRDDASGRACSFVQWRGLTTVCYLFAAVCFSIVGMFHFESF